MSFEMKTATVLITSWVIAYLNIPQEAFTILTILLIIDWITWTLRWVIHKNLTSKKSIFWLLSKMLILLIPVVIALCFKLVGISPYQFLTFIFVAFAFSEAYSILANIEEIRTGKKIPEIDWVSMIISTLLKWIQCQLTRKLKQIESTDIDSNNIQDECNQKDWTIEEINNT